MTIDEIVERAVRGNMGASPEELAREVAKAVVEECATIAGNAAGEGSGNDRRWHVAHEIAGRILHALANPLRAREKS